MKVHGNARLLPRQRFVMCERVRREGWSVSEAAEAFDVSERTVFRWLAGGTRGTRWKTDLLFLIASRIARPFGE
jgi:hypothetical protein